MKFGEIEMSNESLDSNKIVDDLSLWVDLSRRTEEPPFVTHVFLQQVLDLIKQLQTENNDLFYKLAGVMHSVDKWLEGDELKQDEVNRAATMREKTLQTVENLQAENESLKRTVNHTAKGSVKILEMVHEAKADAYRDIIRRIKENSNKMGLVCSGELVRTDYTITEEKLDDFLKDFINKADDSTTNN